MANYILSLQERVKELEAQITQADAGVTDLYMYLQSPKFWNDTTVQVGDVMYRMDENVRRHLHL